MAEIRDNRLDVHGAVADALRSRDQADEQLQQLVKDIQKDRGRVAELTKLDIAQLSPDGKAALSRLIGEQLKGQLPAPLAQQLADGALGNDLLTKLAQRLANANDPNPQNRFGRADSPELARQMATDQSTPQQALRWTQFVQSVQHVPGGLVRDRAGVASPKGEGTTLIEMLASKLGNALGPGLREPKLVDRGLAELSPGQRALLMRATFGDELAQAIQELGIGDPLQLVRAGSLPEGRAALAEALGMSRGKLLALLLRAELLRIGPGRNGELPIRPEMLAALKASGIAMLGTLAALRALSQEELGAIYKKLREASGGFASAVRGGRPPVKRDLIHWARTAARRASDIMLVDREQIGMQLGRGDAQELVQAWYLENLFWTELAQARQRQEDGERVRRDERDRRRDRQHDEQQDGQEDESPLDESLPELEFDEQRADNLMCFWITDFNAHSALSGIVRRMYVCIDPATGAIIPQAVESEYVMSA